MSEKDGSGCSVASSKDLTEKLRRGRRGVVDRITLLRSRWNAKRETKGSYGKFLHPVHHEGFRVPAWEWKTMQPIRTLEPRIEPKPSVDIQAGRTWKETGLAVSFPLSFRMQIRWGRPRLYLGLFEVKLGPCCGARRNHGVEVRTRKRRTVLRTAEQFLAIHTLQLYLPHTSTIMWIYLGASFLISVSNAWKKSDPSSGPPLRYSSLLFLGSRSITKKLFPGIGFKLDALYSCARTLLARSALQRRCARGRIPSGHETEAAWRKYHRWAAQQLAPFITDLVDDPPLANLITVIGALLGSILNNAVSSTSGPLFTTSLCVGNKSPRFSKEKTALADVCQVKLEDKKIKDFTESIESPIFFLDTVEACWIVLRAIYLFVVLLPFLVCCPSLFVLKEGNRLRYLIWIFLLHGISKSGAALIKWGQWAATREDLFPTDLCRVLASLHDDAPKHSFKISRRTIESEFGCKLGDIFDSFEVDPIASGSIAQVHAAVIKEGKVVPGIAKDMKHSGRVAVKVRHPNVADHIRRDFKVVKPLVDFLTMFKVFRWLGLKESLSQFSHIMTAQADLTVEAMHLERSARNFKDLDMAVIPLPVPALVSESVLVETFEEGKSVAAYMRTPTPSNTHIVNLGIDVYLRMLVKDNFVHTDLHPGNILVRETGTQGRGGISGIQLILLDFGLAVELTSEMRHRFISFLFHVASGNSERASDLLLSWAKIQRCTDVEAFRSDMAILWRDHCGVGSRQVDVDFVLKGCLRLCRRHEVSIDVEYAELVLGVCIISGFATSLNPEVNLLDAAVPSFFLYNLCGRLLGRTSH